MFVPSIVIPNFSFGGFVCPTRRLLHPDDLIKGNLAIGEVLISYEFSMIAYVASKTLCTYLRKTRCKSEDN